MLTKVTNYLTINYHYWAVKNDIKKIRSYIKKDCYRQLDRKGEIFKTFYIASEIGHDT